MVAGRYGISGQTVWKWRNRDLTEDRSHRPHRLQTALTPAQEAVAVSLRKTLLLPLDDLLAVLRGFLNPAVSRSGPDGRRLGVSSCRADSGFFNGGRLRHKEGKRDGQVPGGQAFCPPPFAGGVMACRRPARRRRDARALPRPWQQSRWNLQRDCGRRCAR